MKTPQRTALSVHPCCDEFEQLLRYSWPILNQSIQCFTGFIPFGLGMVSDTPYFFQWPITIQLPNFGLESWVVDQISQHSPPLETALLAQQVSINSNLHAALYLDSRNATPLLIYVPFEPSLRDQWWSEASHKNLL